MTITAVSGDDYENHRQHLLERARYAIAIRRQEDQAKDPMIDLPVFWSEADQAMLDKLTNDELERIIYMR